MANRAHKACPNCGTANDRDAVFCGACGRPFAGGDQSAPAASSDQGQKPAEASTMAGRTVFGLPSPVSVRTAGAPGPRRRGAMSGPTLVDLQPPPDMVEPDVPEAAVPPREAPPHLRPQGSSSLVGPTLLEGPAFSVEEMQRGGPARAGELSGPAAASLPAAVGGGRTIWGVPSPLVAPPGDGAPGGAAEPAPPQPAPAPPPPTATPVASSPLKAGAGTSPAIISAGLS